MSLLPPPPLVHVCDLSVDVATPLGAAPTPAGQRRLIPITGGTVSGPLLSGRVLPGGADFQWVDGGGELAELDARYMLETHDGARIYVVNSALRRGTPEVMARLARGEPVDPAQVYFRCALRLHSGDPALAWVNGHLFLGTGARLPQQVQISVWRVD